MGKKVIDRKNRFIFVLTYYKVNLSAICFRYDAMYGKRRGNPLIFLNTAIVMGFEKCQVYILIEGVLLKIKPRRVYMGNNNVETIDRALYSLDKCNNFLASVDAIYLISLPIPRKAIRREDSLDCTNGLPLSFCLIKKPFVPLGELEY